MNKTIYTIGFCSGLTLSDYCSRIFVTSCHFILEEYPSKNGRKRIRTKKGIFSEAIIVAIESQQ